MNAEQGGHDYDPDYSRRQSSLTDERYEYSPDEFGDTFNPNYYIAMDSGSNGMSIYEEPYSYGPVENSQEETFVEPYYYGVHETYRPIRAENAHANYRQIPEALHTGGSSWDHQSISGPEAPVSPPYPWAGYQFTQPAGSGMMESPPVNANDNSPMKPTSGPTKFPSFIRDDIRIGHYTVGETGKKTYRCDEKRCKKSLGRFQELKRHYEEKHAPEDERPKYPCDRCGKTFVRKSRASSHTCHSIPRR
ncbi:hypothetical protein BS50DRAFT_665585 [Corynespora cassiicola Philippines]|uniref:C2H2-type domain-containing protein n=1 Tax=Corynespora cassiicola Philippines TaxID=1448308 RepID=A0A2T2NRL2_CORCC|nr:hypothetical protein BS50DRAFT_665585 [Corynespora cassiicola Philippines]